MVADIGGIEEVLISSDKQVLVGPEPNYRLTFILFLLLIL